MTQKTILIVGAGMSGLYSASLFANLGHKVTVLEKRPDPRIAGNVSRGRSINFTLSYRGLLALSKIGLKEAAIENSVVLNSRMVHLKRGGISRQSYQSTKNSGLYSITRDDLGKLLLKKAELNTNIKFHFEVSDLEIDREKSIAQFLTPSGRLELKSDFIIGADGVFSLTRNIIQEGRASDFKQDYFDWVYKEFTLSEEQLRISRLEFNSVHVWGRDPVLLLGLPNSNGTMTCNLIVPREGISSADGLKSIAELNSLLIKNFKELIPHAPLICEELSAHEWSRIVTMSTRPWSYEDQVVLVGDACHAVVHFYAQGLNASLEDCLVLAEQIQQYPRDRKMAFDEYEKMRKINTDALSELSLQNFRVLIANSTSAKFEAKSRIDGMLSRWMPSIWKTQYSLVAHSNTPYLKVQSITKRQSKIWKFSGLIIFQMLLAFFIFVSRLKKQRASYN